MIVQASVISRFLECYATSASNLRGAKQRKKVQFTTAFGGARGGANSSISTSNHNLASVSKNSLKVVSYSISTSNHNFNFEAISIISLYLILFLHQTTTFLTLLRVTFCCILFYFYIKPQPTTVLKTYMGVVSYSISTSNHNTVMVIAKTSTVVSYSISTSNHNRVGFVYYNNWVVSYSISTSNHNLSNQLNDDAGVVSYSISTSNHNCAAQVAQGIRVVSYSISTSNHNMCQSR